MSRLAAAAALAFLTLQAPPGDLGRMQGTWTMLEGVAGGAPLPAGYLASMRRVLKGTTLTVTLNDGIFFVAEIKLDPKATPKTIDYHMTAGFQPGAEQLGIYELKGDTLRSCFGAPGAPRCTEFKSVPGDRRTVAAWVKAKP